MEIILTEENRTSIRRPILELLVLGLMAETVATAVTQDSATSEAGTTDKTMTGDVVSSVAIKIIDESESAIPDLESIDLDEGGGVTGVLRAWSRTPLGQRMSRPGSSMAMP